MNVLQRLKRLEARGGDLSQDTVFKLEGGGVFRAEYDPLTYLLQNGVETPMGRIVGMDFPSGENDPMTTSIYEEINRIINGEE